MTQRTRTPLTRAEARMRAKGLHLIADRERAESEAILETELAADHQALLAAVIETADAAQGGWTDTSLIGATLTDFTGRKIAGGLTALARRGLIDKVERQNPTTIIVRPSEPLRI